MVEKGHKTFVSDDITKPAGNVRPEDLVSKIWAEYSSGQSLDNAMIETRAEQSLIEKKQKEIWAVEFYARKRKFANKKASAVPPAHELSQPVKENPAERVQHTPTKIDHIDVTIHFDK